MNLLKKKKFRILFIPSNCGGVNFWRLYQFFMEMKNIPHVETAIYRYNPDERVVGRWENEFFQNEKVQSELYSLLKVCDIAILGYCHVPQILALISMFQNGIKLPEINYKCEPKKILAEIDDYVIDTPNYSPAFRSGFTPGNPYEQVVVEHLKMSNAVITSTSFLKQLYSSYNKNINVIPNCIDFNAWDIANTNGHDKVRVGWIGGANHDGDLEIMPEVIKNVLIKTNDVEFYFVHGVPQYIKNLAKAYPKNIKFTNKWSSIDKYPKHMASFGFDIGLAPLVENKFNQAKSNLRWLEYSALKIPCIATDIQPYSESIDNGKTGILVGNNPQEWVDRIVDLATSKSMRKEIGNNAYNKIKKEFNLKDISKDYYKILRGISNE